MSRRAAVPNLVRACAAARCWRAQPAWVTVLVEPVPIPPCGMGGRLTQLGTRPVMMPPAPTEPPLRGLAHTFS